MDPSTEQLIRDYLNRVAVAARRSMGQDEVVAFLARLRESIERHCTAHGVASPADVASVLAALGGPQALVDLEHARLAKAATGRHRVPEPGAAGTDPMTAVGPDGGGPSDSGGTLAGEVVTGGVIAASADPRGGSAGKLLRLPRSLRLGRRRDGQPAGRSGRAGHRPGAGTGAGRVPAGRPAAPGYLPQASWGDHDGEGSRASCPGRRPARAAGQG